MGSVKASKRSLGSSWASERLVGRFKMTPVTSPPWDWITSTTDSRKFGSGMPGLAMRNSALDGATCACAASVKTRTKTRRASSAARQDRFIEAA
jgi:hypothetical protein